MENRLILKVYEMDYSFLIKNYLNPEMWEKTWTLFQYKDIIITLKLYCVYFQDQKLYVLITFEKDGHRKSDTIGISLKIDDLQFFKRAINSKIFELARNWEIDYLIEETDAFCELYELRDQERNHLQEIAEEFLDDGGVTNDTVREAYIEAYVDELETVVCKMDDYRNCMCYTMLSDFYLIWLSSLEDDADKERRLEMVQDQLKKQDKLEEVLEEIREYKEYMETEEFEEDMKSQLTEV